MSGSGGTTYTPSQTSSHRYPGSVFRRSTSFSDSSASRIRTGIGLSRSELPQEAQVVLPELADVVDRVLEHRDPLRAHPEREPTHHIRVVPPVPQHRRV